MAIYHIVDTQTKTVVNIVEWDGVAHWEVDSGLNVVQLPADVRIGYVERDGKYLPAEDATVP